MDLLRTAFRRNDTIQVVDLLKTCISAYELNSLGSDGLALVHIAAEQNATNLLLMLHRSNANLCQLSFTGQSALHVAARVNHLQTADFLIKKGLDVNLKDSNGNMPLHFAAENLSVDMAGLLIRSDAATNMPNNRGDTTIHIAAHKANGSDFITSLASAGARCDVKNTFTGETPLFVAAVNGHLEVVKTLLKLDADPTTRNKQGMSVVQAAENNNQIACRDLLLKNVRETRGIDVYSSLLHNLTSRQQTALPQQQLPIRQQPQPAPMVMVPTPIPVPVNTNMQREVEELRAQNLRLTAQVATLNRDIAQANDRHTDALNRSNQFQQELQRSQAASAVQQNELTQLRNQLAAAREQISSLETALTRTEKERNSTENANTQLRRQLQVAQNTSTQEAARTALMQRRLGLIQKVLNDPTGNTFSNIAL